MLSGEVGRLRRIKLSAILSNLTIAGLALMSLPIVFKTIVCAIAFVVVSVVILLMIGLTLFTILFWGEDILSTMFGSVSELWSSVAFPEIKPLIYVSLAVNISLLICSTLLVVFDRRHSHKGRLTFNAVMAVLTVVMFFVAILAL